MKYAKVLCIMLAMLCYGCGGKDAVQGPEAPTGQQPSEAPQVRVTGASFVPAAGAVQVQWVQTGGAAQSYVLERQHGNAAYQRVAEAQASAVTPSAGGVLGIQDGGVIAGESARYRVGAIGGDGKTHYSEASVVSVPGARLDRVSIRREDANVEVRWHADAENALAYEVVREVEGGEPAVVYVSGSGQATSYEEGPVVGNVRYTYRVRTVLRTGAKIESRPVATGLYVRQISQLITSAQGVRMGLALMSTGGPSICVFRGSDVDVVQRNNNRWEIIYRPQTVPFQIESGSYTSYTQHASVEGPRESYIVGIHPDSREVLLHRYLLIGGTLASDSRPDVFDPAPEAWKIDASYRRTAVAQDHMGRLFVAAGGVLKVFSVSDTRIENGVRKVGVVEIGTVPLPGGDDPGSLVVTATSVWLSLRNEKRLFRGDVQFVSDDRIAGIDWQDLTPPGVVPGALTVNGRGQVLTLDMMNRKVWMLDANGKIVTHLNLAGTGYEAGSEGDLIAGIESVTTNVVYEMLYVVNAAGYIEGFRIE